MMLAMVSASDVTARQLTPAEALKNAQAANNGQQRKARALGESASMDLAYTASRDGANIYYVFNNTGTDGGFVILSADDLAPAVLGYVDSGEFDYANAPDNMKWWLSQYESGISRAIEKGQAISRSEAESRDAVWPLMSTQWNQEEPYNDKCPTVGGSQAPTGCVATAIAQVMYFHRWPETGTGSHSYKNGTGGTTLSADFGSTTYQWDDMLPTYERGQYTEAQADAVSTLMYHCGVSVDMSYGADASGAIDLLLPGALMSYFGYDKAMTLEYRNFYTDDEWEDLVYGEIAAGRPLYYSGVTEKNEGHAFVCDGYDGEGKYHFNWGWGGYCDGYFTLTGTDALDPGGSGTGGGTMGYAFTNQQACLVGAQKAQEGSEVKIVLGSTEYTITNYDGSEATRNSYLIFTGGLYNYSATSVDIEVGMMFKSTSTDDVYYTGITDMRLNVGYGFEGQLPFTAANVTKNGEYEVYPAYRLADGSTEWTAARVPAGMDIPTVTITGDEPSVVLTEQAYIGDGSNVATADLLELHFTLKANKTVTNNVFVGLIYSEYGYDVDYVYTDPISLAAGETRSVVVREYMGDVLSPGETYWLYLCNYTTSEWLTPEDYGEVIFTVADPTGISSPKAEADNKVNVYSMTGMMLRRGVSSKNALDGLPRGMYIVGGKKVVKK